MPGGPQNADAFLGAPTADQFLGSPAAPAPAPAKAPAWSLDLIQQHAGPGTITSAKRSASRNAAVGGSPTSSHLTGDAFDFVPKDRDTARAAKALAAAGIPYDQILDEGDHVHIGWGPKMRGQLKTRGAVQQTADAFLGATKDFGTRYLDTVGKRGRAGVTAMNEGANEFLGGFGLTDAGLVTGPLKMMGGAIESVAAPVSAYATEAGGPAWEALGRATGKVLDRSQLGDVTDILAGFAGPAPKGPKVPHTFKATPADLADLAEAIPGEARVVEPPAAAAPIRPAPAAAVSADEFLNSTAGAVERGKRAKVMNADAQDPLDDVLYAPRQRKPGTISLPETPAATPPKQGIVEGAKDLAASIQAIAAPATKGLGQDSARIIRRAAAQGDLQSAQSAARLQRYAQLTAEMPVEQQRALVNYIENRSSGAKIPDPGLQGVADDIAKVNESYRQRIEEVMDEGEGPSFIRDYYTHMWKDAPQVVEGRILAGRQGSGRNLKARSIPTLQEGIDAGLTPLTDNPVEATMMYADNMSKYLATVDAQREMADLGLSGWFGPGQAPEGWVKLNGIRTEKPGRVIVQDGETVAMHPTQNLYAPADAARVYNNWISNGFDRGDPSKLFNFARKTANGMTMLKLGLSAFHATTMANEGVVSEIARGYQALSKGDVVTGAKAMAGAPAAPITRLIRGRRMTNELLGKNMPKDAMSAAINDAYIRSGGRVRMDRLYRTREEGSLANAIGKDISTYRDAPSAQQFMRVLKNGEWARELKAAGERIYGRDRLMVERFKGTVDLAANLIQSTAAPMFEYAIPRLKQGAFASTMEDWLRTHPNASQEAIDAAAYGINRSIDNRFGEMAWDNLFWHRYLKQASQLMLLSPTWNIGTINEIGGGLLDVLGPSGRGMLKGEGITPRTAYVLALATYVPLMNGVMTYLKTGKRPEDRDFLAYRTGGTDITSGKPERAMMPGYQKDVYAFGYDFPNHIGTEINNKLNPALKMAVETMSNRDWKDQPIRDQNADLLTQAGQYGDYALEQLMPISIGQFAKGDKRSSNVSTAEKMAGIRPAPSYLQDPERVHRLKQLRDRRDWRKKERTDRIDKARRVN